ncbi:MAG TPA: peptide ligase PGM1-related protein, partial [Gemmatimonadota bacterium]|nr:peptide ligase PGM1-related protein [Gemmatimonadota bacterium]
DGVHRLSLGVPMAHLSLPEPVLGLPEEEARERFALLQRKLVPLWKSISRFSNDEQTIVVVPSLDVDMELTGSEMQAYEERMLFLLLLLRQPCARLVYVTSQAISPVIVDYYLDLMPGVIASHARRRLFLVAPLDASPRPLALKLLERPRLIERIRGLILDPDRAHLVPYHTTPRERDLALHLGIPLYGADPRFLDYGTKTGCRRLFREEGVPHATGREGLRNEDDIVRAIAHLRETAPHAQEAMVKLDEGISGFGNALVDLRDLCEPGDPEEPAAIGRRLREMRFELPTLTYEKFIGKLARGGGVVEERLVGDEFRSPSVQLRVTPLGDVEILSTHDQLLGGPSGQSYVGCRFPADPAYAVEISRHARKVGERLAREGVLGRFALDFVVARERGGEWRTYAIEVNLRKGGTTHPFLTLQFLTDGRYDPGTGVFTAPGGQPKSFVASDKVVSPLYRAFTPDDLFDIVARHGLHFDQTRQEGVVFHMMGALGECGRVGLTAVGNSPAEAGAIQARALEVLEEEAQAAVRPHPVPGPSTIAG